MSHHTKIIRLTLISFLMALLLAGNQVSFGQVSAAGTVTVTVTLMDGGGHMDMPLYGYVRVGSFAPSYSDPFTGQLTLSLDQGTDYTIRAYSQGYVTQTRVVNYTSSVASETFSLLPDPDSGCPLGYQPGAEQTQVTVLNEGFESGVFPPAGWQQFIYDASQPIWAAGTDKYTGGFSAFHDRISTEDSFYYNALISAPIHIPASGQLTLYHKTNGQSSSSPSSLYLYLYDNVTQQALVSYGGIPIADTWQKATYNLTSFAGRDYSIGFYYYNNNNLSEWYLDDIKVEGIQRTCQVLNGGRITGYVSDSLTKYPLKGATVTLAGLTTETPLSGLYFLWSATGTVQVGASASRHFALAKNVMVTVNSVTRQDFALEPGYTLTTAVNGEGAGTITGNNATLYHMGEVVHLTAIPSPGANFTGWSGNGTDDGNRGNNPLALTITGNMTLSAVFGLNPVDVTVTFKDGDSHAGMPLMGVITVRATTTAGGSIDTPMLLILSPAR